MTDLLDLADKLQDTNAAIATMERALADTPSSEAAGMALRSLERRRGTLERQFAEHRARTIWITPGEVEAGSEEPDGNPE